MAELPAALGRPEWAGEMDAALLLVPPDQVSRVPTKAAAFA